MKKTFFCILFFLVNKNIFAQQATAVNVISSNQTETVVAIQVGEPVFIDQQTPNDLAQIVQIKGATPWLEKGAPNLPKIAFTLQIPNTKNSSISIIDSSFTDYPNINIAPSKGNISRQLDPSKIPFTYGEVYTTNSFYPLENTVLQTPFIFRDYRAQTVQIAPVQYNAVSKTLRVYKQLVVKIKYEGTSNTNTLATNNYPEKIPAVYNELYKNLFKNYQIEASKTRYTPLVDSGAMLVLCPSKYFSGIQQFINWKNQIGIPTALVNIDTLTGGVSESTIQSFIKNFYVQHHNTFVTLVGDNTDIPPMNENNTSALLAGPSDNAYGYITGNDHYQEIIIGRFSGESVSDIATQVTKTINYEKHIDTSGNWMSTVLSIGSNDPGQGLDNLFDWQFERRLNDSLINYGPYTNRIELFDGDKGGVDANGDPTPQNVISAINAGCSLINYTGHGGVTGLVTTGFSNTDVSNLLDTSGKYPVAIIVGCQVGNFINFTCFAEAMARAQYNNKPTGLVASAMSTINQSWEPPMYAQQEMNGLIRKARGADIKTSFGGIAVNGFAAMNEQYNTTSTPTDGSDMTDTWVVFGDPSLQLYTSKIQPPLGFTTLICTTNEVLMYPNPTNSQLHISAPFTILDYTIIDITGKIIETKKGVNNTNYCINTEKYCTGNYILQLQTSNGIFIKKFTKN